MVIIPVFSYWSYSLFFYALSHSHLTSVQLHRIPINQKLRPANSVSEWQVLKAVLFQHVLQMFLGIGLAVHTNNSNEQRITDHKMEVWWLVLLKLGVAAVMLDTYQYWMHRLAHTNRFLYRNFHSVHHRLTVPYAFGALYNHPVEGFVMDTLGGAIPTLFLNMHPWTSCLFFSIATLKTVDDHCGFSLTGVDPLQFLFSNNAGYHDIHHWGKGRMYNFSQPFFTFWDKAMGTEYKQPLKRIATKRVDLKEE